MFKKIILLTISIVTGALVFGQRGREGTLPVARATEKGIWVYTGNQLPRGFGYIIERKTQNSNRYERIGKTQSPNSISELASLNQHWSYYFDKLDKLSEQEIEHIWNYLQRNSSNDSLTAGNLPVMHLIAGTALLDTTVQKGQTYIYRISRSDSRQSDKPETPPVTWPASPRFPAIQPTGNTFANGILTLTWSVKALGDLAHFNIYRSVFGKNEFQKRPVEKGIYQQNNTVVLLAFDKTGTQPAWYEYRVEPVDIYGNAGTALASGAGGTMTTNYAPPVKQLKATGMQQDHQIKLSWKYENKKYISGISIMRSSQFDSGYQRIASVPVTDSTYTDIVPVAGENYYYYLQLYTADTEPVATAKVAALYYSKSEKPRPPQQVGAETVPNGVRIYWTSNEPYINGFYVYRNSGSNEDFVQVSALLPSGEVLYSFTDSSKNLQAGEVYQYAVKSLNDINQLSEMSDTVSAYPGIAASLSSPQHVRYSIHNNHITLIWDDLRATENNLLGYTVLRRTGTEKNFQPLTQNISTADKNYFTDSSALPGVAYEYTVTARDFFGNESVMSKIVQVSLTASLPPVPAGIQALPTDNSVTIRWGQLSGDGLKVKIHRSDPGQKTPGNVATVDSFEGGFTDRSVVKGRLYFYQLSTIDTKGKESLLSEKLGVRVQ